MVARGTFCHLAEASYIDAAGIWGMKKAVDEEGESIHRLGCEPQHFFLIRMAMLGFAPQPTRQSRP